MKEGNQHSRSVRIVLATSGGYLVLLLLLSVFGVYALPDPTPYANTQNPDQAVQPLLHQGAIRQGRHAKRGARLRLHRLCAARGRVFLRARQHDSDAFPV